LDGTRRIAALKARAEADLDSDDDELFASGRGNGTRELTGQRVLQVATVIRNLSFEEDNSPVLAKNLTCLRFVLLCVNSSWANLNQMGFDILSNIASEVVLEEPSEDAVTDLLFSTLGRCIGAQDRFQVISSLDVLNKLCSQQVNEDFIIKLLEQSVYGQLTEYLSLHDIHLLITVLECLYSLTSLGEVPCNALVKTHSAVELLVSLVTVEAQSYGPKACILMRVVETVPGTTATTGPAQPAGQTPTTTVASAVPATLIKTPSLPTTPLPQPQVSNILPRHPMPLTRPPTLPTAPAIGASLAAPMRPAGPPGSQQVQLRVSNDEPHRVFCLSWLKATYEPCPGKSIEQNIMYKQYLASMHRMGRKEVISAQHYALCIRTLFGGSTGPNKKQVGDKMENHYTGIQVRAQPLPLKLTPAQAAAAQEASRQQSAQQVVQQTPNPVVTQNGGVMQQVGVVQQKVVNQQGQVVHGVHVNSQGQLVNSAGQVVQTGGIVKQVNQQGQVIQVANQGQHIVQVNSQGQQIVQVNQSGQQVVQVAAPGQQIVQSTAQGQQILQTTPQGTIVRQVSPSSHVVLNQQGQVVQQRIVNSSGQIVASGVVQGGTVVSQGIVQQRSVTGQVVQQGNNYQGAVVQQPGGQVIQRVIQQGGQRVVQQGGQVVIQGATQSAQIIQNSNPGGQIIQTQPSIIQNSSGQQQVVCRAQTRPVSTAQVTTSVTLPAQVSSSTTCSIDSSQLPALKQPKSPILADLLARASPGPENSEPPVLSIPHTPLTVRPISQPRPTTGGDEVVENGLSPLDGILPKDPQFGKLEEGLSDLLEKKGDGSVINGVVPKINHVTTDFAKMNGDSATGKRLAGDNIETSPAKRQALDNTIVANGGLHGPGGANGSLNGGGRSQVVSSSNSGVIVSSGQQMVLVSQAGSQQGGQLVQTSGGQLFLKTTNSSGGAVLVPTGQGVVQQQGVQVVSQRPAVQQQQAVLVQQAGQQGKTLIYITPEQAKQQQQQQVVRQVVVGGQQHPVRVTQVDNQVTQIDGAEESPVPQLDGADDVPQLDGMGIVPGEPPQQPVIPQNTVGQEGRPGVVVTAGLVPTNGQVTPSATPPPMSVSPGPSTAPSTTTTIKIDTQKPFLCEWAGCMTAFKSPKEVENHAIAEHCPLGSNDLPCLWARCDGMKRKRFSLMTHLQDRHCHPQLMKLMAVRRVQIAQSGKSEVPLPPAPPPHPGYAPNAALHAIKRHAVEFVSPKELAMRDEKEGPVTKSIRLTASLILRNLVIYSSLGRSRLRAFESHLSTVALSNVESSRTVSQILYEMANAKDYEFPV